MTATKKYGKVAEDTASLRREALSPVVPIMQTSTVRVIPPIAEFADLGDYLIPKTPVKVSMVHLLCRIDSLDQITLVVRQDRVDSRTGTLACPGRQECLP